MPHPRTVGLGAGFVTGGPVQLAHLWARPDLSVMSRSGWDAFDRLLAEPRRTVVLLDPLRSYSSAA